MIPTTVRFDSSLVQIARHLGDLGWEAASRSEKMGQLSEDVVGAIRDSGLAGMGLPADLGGLASPPVVTAEVLERIATGDAATAWVVMIASTSSLTAAYLDPDGAKQVWSDGAHTLTAGVLAPKGKAVRTDGGYRISGRWPFASGIKHASWVSGGVVIEGEPGIHIAFFPISQVEILDTWRVIGLKATGSHDFEVADATVGEALVTSIDTVQPWTDEPLYRFPIYGLLAAGVAAVSLGIAAGAIEDLRSLAADKVPTGSRRSLGERPIVHEEVARALAAIDAARCYLHDTMERLWEGAVRGGSLAEQDRVQLRMAATWAVEAAARTTETMYRLAGGTAVYESSPLERRLRDINAAAQHMMVARPTWEVAGRVLLGVQGDHGQL